MTQTRPAGGVQRVWNTKIVRVRVSVRASIQIPMGFVGGADYTRRIGSQK